MPDSTERMLGDLFQLFALAKVGTPEAERKAEEIFERLGKTIGSMPSEPQAIFEWMADLTENKTTAAVMRFIAHLANSRDDEPPPTLYHYTTFEGLAGILETRRLWATEVAYLNDAAERIYSNNLIEDIFAEQARIHGVAIEPLLREARQFLDWLSGERLRFVTCFCDDGDLLSMWRAYANNGGGFSLGFTGSAIVRVGKDESFPGVHVATRVRYGDDVTSDPVVKAFAQLCAEFGQSGGELPADALGGIANFLDLVFIRAKDASFREEREWRILLSHYLPEAIYGRLKFRRGLFDIKPYLEVGMPRNWDDEENTTFESLPIESVTIGPALRPRETERAVRLLLARHDLEKTVEVRISRTPYQL